MNPRTEQLAVDPSPRRFQVLIVDDEDDLRASVRRTLRSPEFQIHESSSASEALVCLGYVAVDVVISDFDMPQMNGLDFLQRVRLAHPTTLRILLTGRGSLDMAARALNEGSVHRFFQKPWDSVNLRGAIRIALSTHTGRSDKR